jgi:phosphatidylserine decarboxylase
MARTTAEGAWVAREGYPFIAIAGAACLLALWAGWGLVGLLLALLTGWVVWFFRNPPRIIPAADGLVLAPADGRVVDATPDVGTGWDGEAGGARVGIFMNVFNVHVNRMPVTGRVEAVEYVPGAFINASLDKASEHNERNGVTVRTPEGHAVRFVQIAGLVARRIVCWLRPGAEGAAGDIFGLIRFGSRVDVHLPAGAELWVTEGQRVTAGETVLGKLP